MSAGTPSNQIQWSSTSDAGGSVPSAPRTHRRDLRDRDEGCEDHDDQRSNASGELTILTARLRAEVTKIATAEAIAAALDVLVPAARAG
jgi:hypothetical protein